MLDRFSRPSSPHREHPVEYVSMNDNEAQSSASSSDVDHFSDASEGHQRSQASSSPGRSSPISRTRVEKTDDVPRHGDVPATAVFGEHREDAAPVEIEVILEGSRNRSHSTARSSDISATLESRPISTAIGGKVNPEIPSHAEIPNTVPYERSGADAVPDLLNPSSNSSASVGPSSTHHTSTASAAASGTLLSQVEFIMEAERSSGSRAHQSGPSEAPPDLTVHVNDSANLRTSSSISSTPPDDDRSKHILINDSDTQIHDVLADQCHLDNEENSPIKPDEQEELDDFDDFAEQDDFGEFDDGVTQPDANLEDKGFGEHDSTLQHPITLLSIPPLIDFDSVHSLSDLLASIDSDLDNLFPASKDIASLPSVKPISDASAIFGTERSLSLWAQLVANPSLQPPNWVKSRIRRLFLVSLGVPVDLDEILPASKQKKLVLPSIDLLNAPEGHRAGSQTRSSSQPRISGSADGSARNSSQLSRQQQQQRSTRSRRERLPAPDLDLLAVQRLCATTDAALDGLTDAELSAHVKDLEKVTLRASAVLEYWLKRRETLVSEKEAFEGVIENLVNHARRARK